MEAKLDTGTVILDRIAVLEIERAAIEARIATEMLAFVDLRRREADSAGNTTIRDLEISFAADELALVLWQPTRTVQCRLVEARRVRGILPLTWEGFCAGKVDAYRVRLIASAADKLTDRYALIQLDYEIVGYASTHTAAQVKAWLRRFVAREEPDKGAERTRLEVAKRGVWVDHQDDGMSYLTAYLPTPEAVRIDHELTRLAKQSAAQTRSFDQMRADLFCDQMLGRAGPAKGRTGVVIGVTIPVASLAGLTNEAGESFDGEFALPAQLVRDLAAEPGTLFHRIITDPLGRILDVTETGRFPSGKLDLALQIRDGTCAFLTCSRRSIECDNDHVEAHPRGPTSGRNLKPLCRRHHRMKTYGIVGTSIDSSGTHRWHLPTGGTVDSEARTLNVGTITHSRTEVDLATWLTTIHYAA